MLQVSELFVYPIKSLGGVSLSSAVVTDRGLQYDRRWMLVDDGGNFLSQRTCAAMALLQVEILDNGLRVCHKNKRDEIFVPFAVDGPSLMTEVWSDRCRAIQVDEKLDQWFSDMLSLSCKLVYMPDRTNRRVDGRYALNKEITSFSDGYPFLLIGQSSLDDLNGRIEEALPMNRFRPNIVVSGGLPFEEDGWEEFVVNGIYFYGVKLCARCVVTTIDQDSSKKGKEPLKTLATYRMDRNKIYFGQNLLHKGSGQIKVGDGVEVLKRKQLRFQNS